MKKILSILLPIIILAGCSTDGFLKKSANNKLIDNKGFHGGKRRPLYNKKYIDKAKLNISRGDFEEDDEYSDEEQYIENLPPTLKNRYIYEDMIEEDLKKERARRAKKKSAYLRHMKQNQDGYPNLGKGRDRVRDSDTESDNGELKKELKEIRTLLDAAREDLVKYRCPIDENGKPVAIKHEVKPKKIHEHVKAEETSKAKPAPKKAPVAKPKAKPTPPPKPEPKLEAPKPVPDPKPAPKPKPVEKPAKMETPHHEHSHDELHHSGHSHAHPHPPVNNEVYYDPTEEQVQETKPEETVTHVPEMKPEIEELDKPQLTEIPPAPSDDEGESDNPSIPELPGFPTQ